MMKQKWYLLIICLVSCVTLWAQDDKPLWSIIDLKLTKVTDGDDKVIYITEHIGMIGIDDGIASDGIREGVEQPIYRVLQTIRITYDMGVLV